jgi:integrase/recombinase XerD
MKTSTGQDVSPVGEVHDEMLLRMWLHGKHNNTADAYHADATLFLKFICKPLTAVVLSDLQAWDEDMQRRGHAEASRCRRLAVIKSLCKFAHGIGYLTANPTILMKSSKPRSVKAERILTEADVLRMIGAESDPRCRAALRLLYVCGLRASEACALIWKDMSPARKGGGGEARIFGKGRKERTVVIPPALWQELAALTRNTAPTSPVLSNRDGKALDRVALHRIVKRAARRAKLDPAISAHWLRHSHASHSLDRGCAPHVLQKSMGHASLATTTGYLHVRPGEGSASFIKE